MQEFEEISLRDLILLLLRGWKLIVATTLVSLVIAIGVFFTLNVTTYTATSQVRLTFSPDYNSKYGSYTMPWSKVEDFINLLKEDTFIDRLSSVSELDSNQLKTSLNYIPVNTNDFTMSVSGPISNEASEIANRAKESVEIYQDYVSFIVSRHMFSTFDSSFRSKLVDLQESKTDKQKMLTYFETELNNTTPLLNNNVVNPVFSNLSANFVQMKTSIAEIDFLIDEINEHLKEVENNLNNLSSIESFITNKPNIDGPRVSFVFSDISLTKTQRYNAKSLFPISTILGAMLGVFLVFFKNYWTNSSNK